MSQPIYNFAFDGTFGTTEDWSYEITGGFGFTFEFDHEAMHPPFREVVREYSGGNRDAYRLAQALTASTRRHAVLRGTAPPGAALVATRMTRMPTWRAYNPISTRRGPKYLKQRLTVRMNVPATGSFAFHLNPSTSPVAVFGQEVPKGERPALDGAL